MKTYQEGLTRKKMREERGHQVGTSAWGGVAARFTRLMAKFKSVNTQLCALCKVNVEHDTTIRTDRSRSLLEYDRAWETICSRQIPQNAVCQGESVLQMNISDKVCPEYIDV